MVRNNKGFSLIELIIVVTILAVLLGILAPNLLKYLGSSRQTVCLTNRDTYARQYYAFAASEETLPTFENFRDYMDASGSPLSAICPSHGAITGKITDYTLALSCSEHDGSAGTAVQPANTRSSVFVLDPVSGKYVEIKVHDTGQGQKSADITGRIIYYDGDLYENGYYYINAWRVRSSIEDMDTYITDVTTNVGSGVNFIKLNTDVPIQTYDAASQNASSKQSERNTIVFRGGCFYIDFDWDDVDGPVLAMYNGSTTDAGWRGDLSSTVNSNQNKWTILEVQ